MLRYLLFFITLVVLVEYVTGCGGSTTMSVSSDSNVAQLLDKLPNLKKMGFETCSFTITKISAGSGMPSPSDTKMELVGFGVVSDNALKDLKSRFIWKSIDRKDIPKRLLAIVPAGNVLASDGLNSTFSDNRLYGHGFVVIKEDGNSRDVYFVATDLDHRLD